MQRTTFLLGSIALAMTVLTSCESSRPPADSPGSGINIMGNSIEKDGIRLIPFDDSPKFPNARLRLQTPSPNASVPSGEVKFEYALSDFKLTDMTGGRHEEQMARSMKGQHIHNIVDNQPYTAHYETSFAKPLADGSHVVLSFLSRSYHESLKQPGAYDLRVINVGSVPAAAPPIDIKQPTLFYSRPKDEYIGDDAKRIMLDFYLVNTSLDPDGNKVRATINGTEFLLDKWLPYQMEGLPSGENTIKLELVDSDGKLLPGAYNSVTRTFIVTPQQ
jgi:hypothetical protein